VSSGGSGADQERLTGAIKALAAGKGQRAPGFISGFRALRWNGLHPKDVRPFVVRANSPRTPACKTGAFREPDCGIRPVKSPGGFGEYRTNPPLRITRVRKIFKLKMVQLRPRVALAWRLWASSGWLSVWLPTHG